tara:strand:+ start:1070 stop:1852 length:783 start_codon:yes stop_codon:yes gene_type:complete
MGLRTSIFDGMVVHSRLIPKKHNFKYRVFSILFNIDDLSDISNKNLFFSYNKFNLFSFFDRDHGEKDGSKPRSWILKIAKKQKIKINNLRIFCLCYPRILGYAFNPISTWFVYDENYLKMIVYEVRNTFGEDHSYSFKIDDDFDFDNHKTKKLMHVSPFISMDGEYKFSTKIDENKVSIVIRGFIEKKHLITASFRGKYNAFNDKRLIINFIKYPLLTLKVTYGIHFQALILWFKNIKYIKHTKSKYYKISYNEKYKEND